MTEKNYSPGLEGVIAGLSGISEIDPEKVRLTYRGYSIDDLAEHSTFEEVCYLLLHSTLPNQSALDSFSAELASSRELPPPLIDSLGKAPKNASVMDALRTGVSYLGMTDPDTGDNSRDANVRKAMRLISQTSTLVAAIHRLRNDLDPVAPRADLSYAKNLLTMIRDAEPDDVETRTLDVSLILYAEHTFNASTFAARVICSTLADMHGSIAGAIGALKGPLHGGANEAAMQMLIEIGEPDKAEAYVLNKLATREKIMGFGHRVYKYGDSRVPFLTKLGKELSVRRGETKWHEIADTMEAVMLRAKEIHPNVDFPCGYVYHLLDLPLSLYTPLFAAARMVGWCTHVIEQHDDNRLIRPSSIYNGDRDQPFVPIDERDA